MTGILLFLILLQLLIVGGRLKNIATNACAIAKILEQSDSVVKPSLP